MSGNFCGMKTNGFFVPAMKNHNFETNISTDMKAVRTIRTRDVIHGFALLHIAVAVACRFAGVMDELWLTLLTVTMVVLICVGRKAKMELIAASVILVNLVGYMLGVYGAKLISMFTDSELLTHAASTFITTELLGWGVYGFLGMFRRTQTASAGSISCPPQNIIGREHVIWLAAAIGVILIFRTLLTLSFSGDVYDKDSLLHTISFLGSKSGSIIIMLCITVLLIRYVRKRCTGWSTVAKTALIALFVLLMSCGIALAAELNLPFGPLRRFDFESFSRLLITVTAIELIFCSIIYMTDYAFSIREAMYSERSKANRAEFQYEQLRQQVNPHFLFNSLNILDCLVRDGQTEHASAYIHKLAGIYRYMLRKDGRTVPLQDEMTFVGLYVDLLKERFQDGFRIVGDLSEETQAKKQVIPCSVQMLIENAIKHNIVGGQNPLTIRITSDGKSLTVRNDLRPKITGEESTKVGLDYLRRQYHDLCGEDVLAQTDGSEFSVTIPLIDKED